MTTKREPPPYWHDDRDLGTHITLTDATSFAMMERLGITHAFTADRNCTHYGFAVLTP